MAEIKQGGEQFASRWGLIATILGMAVGTGNMRRGRVPRHLCNCVVYMGSSPYLR